GAQPPAPADPRKLPPGRPRPAVPGRGRACATGGGACATRRGLARPAAGLDPAGALNAPARTATIALLCPFPSHGPPARVCELMPNTRVLLFLAWLFTAYLLWQSWEDFNRPAPEPGAPGELATTADAGQVPAAPPGDAAPAAPQA